MKIYIYKSVFRSTLLIVSFTLLIISVHFIQRSSIKANVISSIKIIETEGLYKEILHFKLFQLDNFTDALMLNEAVSADSQTPVKAAMLNTWNKSDNYFNLAKDTESFANGNFKGLKSESYGRYWHGYLCVLKPLLCFTDYSQIRILNFIFLFSLVFFVLYKVYKRIGTLTMIYFLATLMIINFPIVPLSMQFSSVFYIAFIAILVLLFKEKQIEKYSLIYIVFFCIGAFTSFLDLLTAPLITLGLPLLIYFQLEPYLQKNPWSEVLADKKVLVIHPFNKTIESQYKNNREHLFKDKRVLPEFKSLETIKAVQTIAGNREGFKDWFEALEYMKKEIDKKDFDIAIIGCGAYGFPLAAHVKRIGKKAVHLGGPTQMLFGIKGKRWIENEKFDSIINEYFVFPSVEDIPENANKVEGGCYW